MTGTLAQEGGGPQALSSESGALELPSRVGGEGGAQEEGGCLLAAEAHGATKGAWRQARQQGRRNWAGDTFRLAQRDSPPVSREEKGERIRNYGSFFPWIPLQVTEATC